jgi:hypothetical protein
MQLVKPNTTDLTNYLGRHNLERVLIIAPYADTVSLLRTNTAARSLATDSFWRHKGVAKFNVDIDRLVFVQSGMNNQMKYKWLEDIMTQTQYNPTLIGKLDASKNSYFLTYHNLSTILDNIAQISDGRELLESVGKNTSLEAYNYVVSMIDAPMDTSLGAFRRYKNFNGVSTILFTRYVFRYGSINWHTARGRIQTFGDKLTEQVDKSDSFEGLIEDVFEQREYDYIFLILRSFKFDTGIITGILLGIDGAFSGEKYDSRFYSFMQNLLNYTNDFAETKRINLYSFQGSIMKHPVAAVFGDIANIYPSSAVKNVIKKSICANGKPCIDINTIREALLYGYIEDDAESYEYFLKLVNKSKIKNELTTYGTYQIIDRFSPQYSVVIINQINHTLIGTTLSAFYIPYINATDEQRNIIISDVVTAMKNKKLNPSSYDDVATAISINLHIHNVMYGKYNDYIELLEYKNSYTLAGILDGNTNIIATIMTK